MKTPIRTMGEAKYLRKGDFDETERAV